MSSSGKGWIDVETSRRSYSARGDARVTWERGEKVVSIEPHDDDGELMAAAREERESREVHREQG